ncbi:MAG: DNA primase [Candidatus Paceibacterota bacterium]|jgi:DNA primase|nr:DNA primase [Candidatus Paceibacterota bacterium]MDD4875210.1 DNA primase [Candidatus Paceibacterota bacterium]
MDSPIEEIKNRLNIVDVVGGYLKLQKAGSNWRACCPFHNEKSPSFFVSPGRQIWHCFGCSKGGDVFSFVQEIEGVEFGDALKILAQKAGVELKPQSPEWQKLKTERQRLYDICDLACRFYEVQLNKSKTGQEAKKYLLSRGAGEESIAKWRLGFSPDAWQGLSDFLVGKNYTREEIAKAGLAVKNREGNFYDRFRGRIMFPIFDANSQVVGFGGRIFSESKANNEGAKYINISNTLIYDKSRILYGIDKAKFDVRKKDFCVLVEGYMDCILSHQAGVENAVAVSGTALTSWHLNLLKRYSQNLILSFDMDAGGSEASRRGIDLAGRDGFNIKMAIMPEGKDPADVIFEKGAETWQETIGKAKPIIEYYFNLAFTGRDPENISDKKEIAKIILPEIKKLSNKIEQNYWLQELAKKIRAREEDLEGEMIKIKMETDVSDALQKENPKKEHSENCQKTKKELLEEELLVIVLSSPETIKEVPKEMIERLNEPAKGILSEIKNDPEISQADLEKKFANSPEESSFLGQIFLRSDLEKEDSEGAKESFKACLIQMQLMHLKKDLDNLSFEIKSAERLGDAGKTKELLSQFNNLAKKLKQ